MVVEGGGGEVVQNPVIITMLQRAKGRCAMPCTVSLASLSMPCAARTACLAVKPKTTDCD